MVLKLYKSIKLVLSFSKFSQSNSPVTGSERLPVPLSCSEAVPVALLGSKDQIYQFILSSINWNVKLYQILLLILKFFHFIQLVQKLNLNLTLTLGGSWSLAVPLSGSEASPLPLSGSKPLLPFLKTSSTGLAGLQFL